MVPDVIDAIELLDKRDACSVRHNQQIVARGVGKADTGPIAGQCIIEICNDSAVSHIPSGRNSGGAIVEEHPRWRAGGIFSPKLGVVVQGEVQVDSSAL